MKIYITKHILTQGIIEKDGEILDGYDGRMVEIGGLNSHEYYHKPYWHLTKEEAIEHAIKLKANKINSLKKQITKLEKLTF